MVATATRHVASRPAFLAGTEGGQKYVDQGVARGQLGTALPRGRDHAAEMRPVKEESRRWLVSALDAIGISWRKSPSLLNSHTVGASDSIPQARLPTSMVSCRRISNGPDSRHLCSCVVPRGS